MPLLVLVWTAFAGTVEEGVQWWVETRTGEIRDVLLNAFSGLCGLVFGLSLEPPERFRWRISALGWRRLTSSAAVLALTLGVFFYAAHLGYLVEDPEIGVVTCDPWPEGGREVGADEVPDPGAKVGDGDPLAAGDVVGLPASLRGFRSAVSSFRQLLHPAGWIPGRTPEMFQNRKSFGHGPGRTGQRERLTHRSPVFLRAVKSENCRKQPSPFETAFRPG